LEEKTYYLNSDFIFRGDLGFSPEFVSYNILTGKSYELGKDFFKAVLLFCKLNNYREIKKKLGIKNIEKLKKLNFVSLKKSQNKVFLYPETNFKVPVCYYPREIELHLTSYCNLRCKHCVYDVSTKKKEFLSFDILFKFLDELEEIGIFRLIISGGEPFLHRDIKQIIKKIATKRYRVEFLTNAVLINNEIAQILSRAKNISITYSLDGHNPNTCDFLRGKGVFNKVLNAVALMNKFEIKHNLCCVLNKRNFNYIDKIIELGYKLKSLSVNFLFLDLMGRGENLKKEALDEFEIKNVLSRLKNVKSKIPINFINQLDIGKGRYSNFIYCAAGTFRLAVSSNGEVYPCAYAFNNKDFMIGNISLLSIKNLWYSKKWELFRGGIKIDDLKECLSCSLIKRCMLKNCRLRAFSKYRNIYAKYPGCKIL